MTSPSKSRDWSDRQIDNNAIQSYVKTGSHCQCSILNCGWTNVTWGQTFTKCILSLKLCLNFSGLCLYWKCFRKKYWCMSRSPYSLHPNLTDLVWHDRFVWNCCGLFALGLLGDMSKLTLLLLSHNEMRKTGLTQRAGCKYVGHDRRNFGSMFESQNWFKLLWVPSAPCF